MRATIAPRDRPSVQRDPVAPGRALGSLPTGEREPAAPGMDGETVDGIVSRGEQEGMVSHFEEQRRAKTYPFRPVRRVDIPTRI